MTTNPGLGTLPRRATRSADDRLLGGVAGGLADHLGVPVLAVRAFFLLSTLFGGLGVLLYGGLWLTLPLGTPREEAAPGLEAATRQGKRPAPTQRLRDLGPLVSLGALAIGIVALAQIVWGATWIWPVGIALAGVVVLWWQADEAQRDRWLDRSGKLSPLRAVTGSGGVASYARLVAGVGLLVIAIAIFGVQTGRATVARDVLIAGVLGIVGIALMLGPWLLRLTGDLSEERAARVRQQERADMAAHLHDSVLQTLALIQKHSGDPRTVATLARAQERDLRQWLYGEAVRPETTVAGALKAVAAEVEDSRGVPVEVVTVGDRPSSERTAPVVNAAREAMLNAAKHSGAVKVDVYAEISPDILEVFVRDRGAGFLMDDVAADRLGVRNSIIDRMDRHGGTAAIRTAPGEGTEVHLSMNLEETA